MRTVYVADTGVFVRCGGPDRETYQRLRRAVRRADTSLRIPQSVYRELGGDPAAEEYHSVYSNWLPAIARYGFGDRR